MVSRLGHGRFNLRLWTMVQSQHWTGHLVEEGGGRWSSNPCGSVSSPRRSGVSVERGPLLRAPRWCCTRLPRTSGRLPDLRASANVDRVRLARQLQQLGLTVYRGRRRARPPTTSATRPARRNGGAWMQVEARVEAQLAELRRTRRVIKRGAGGLRRRAVPALGRVLRLRLQPVPRYSLAVDDMTTNRSDERGCCSADMHLRRCPVGSSSTSSRCSRTTVTSSMRSS